MRSRPHTAFALHFRRGKTHCMATCSRDFRRLDIDDIPSSLAGPRRTLTDLADTVGK